GNRPAKNDGASGRAAGSRSDARDPRPVASPRERAMSDVPPIDPEELLSTHLRQAAEDRRRAHKERRLQQERLRPYRELRPRWERGWDAAYLWPGEQHRRGRKPDPQGFLEWAGLWVEVGEVLKALDRIGQRPELPSDFGPVARLARAARSGVRALD